jgi:hypothetical protein
MATFRHKYAALVLQDDKGVWAQFQPHSEISSDGREIKYGTLETTDAALIKRLRALKDPDLSEVKDDEKADESADQAK